MTLSSMVLVVWGIVLLVAVAGYGGLIESLRRWDSRPPRFALGALAVALTAAVIFKGTGYLTQERQELIEHGRYAGDSVSSGYDTKARFRSRAQPLGRILDRNGVVLAEYQLRDGHLVRAYPAGRATAHLVGYWAGPRRDGAGIEKALSILNDSLDDGLPHDVQLSIDLTIQNAALRALGSYEGAIVVMDAASGQVIAAADNPEFDPEKVSSDDVWKQYIGDTRHRPLTSRAIKDNFSPGSSIKVLVAAAALQWKTPLPEVRGFSCAGFWTPRRFIKPIADHGSAHGAVDLARAMRVSCNVYFARLAYEFVGFEAVKEFLESIGFNERLHWNTALALNTYATLLPAASWVRGRDEIARTRLGIGQASVKTNPIHFAAVIGGIANNGTFLRPTLELARKPDTLPWRLQATVAERVQELMREPVLSGGTASSAFPGGTVYGIKVFGKTGTADPEPDGREPSWFVSYGTMHGRTLVVIVAVQNRFGKMAGGLNAPMARTVFEALGRRGYFRK